MGAEISPGLVLLVGACLVPLVGGWLRTALVLALPVLALAAMLFLEQGLAGRVELFDIELVTLRVDGLSLVFGYIFALAALLGAVYQLHVRDTLQHVAGLAYAGSAIGAVFAGDLLTLFLFWEGTAIASVFLVWASRSEAATAAGMRYLLVQVTSGVLLLAGALVHYGQTGSLAFGELDPGSLGGALILVSFGIKCAFPLLHAWLKDAYPEATVTGTVLLSVFTTKLAVYALARGFAGTDLLVPIGMAMCLFPVVFALVENDLRRALAYGLNSQLGFMVVGVGIGSELALNGAVAHAVCSVLYQALLFMSVGAVLFRTGTAKGSDLGGLHRSMPWTTGFGLVGAASISAVPLFSGFVSKSMIISAAMYEGQVWTWLVLLAGGVGAVLHSGLRVPYLAFFAGGGRPKAEEAPTNMLVAMGASAALCVAIGVLPGLLYAFLPFEVDYAPYTLEHIVTQLQLLALTALAFALALRAGLFPAAVRSTVLDVDWLYRHGLYRTMVAIYDLASRLRGAIGAMASRKAVGIVRRLYSHHGPEGVFARTWPTGNMAFWTTVLLAAYLIASFL